MEWKIDGSYEHQTTHWGCTTSSASSWHNRDILIRNTETFIVIFFSFFVCPYLQMADWLYAGPSAALSAWPTWVCVRPRDSRRILNALANSRISSRLTPSTSLGAVCGSTIQQTHLILLALCSSVAYLIFQSEWSKHSAICDHARL